MILITGASGFLGSYITKLMVEKGYAVKATYRANKLPFYIPSEISKNVIWVKGNVLDADSLQSAMQGVDTIIHAAGIVSYLKKDRKEMYDVNINGTRNIVTIALEKNIKKFVHISSIAAIGTSSNGSCLNEESKWVESKFNTHYAITKLRSEQEVWQALNKGLNGVIINPSTILGFGDWNNSSCEIFKNVYEEFKWYSGGVSGFVDVEDVAYAVLLLMELNISRERFIISNENWSFKKLMNTIADGFGKKHPDYKATLYLLSIVWRLEKLKSFFNKKEPLLTKEIATVAQSITCFKNDKILSALPQFSFSPLEKTIESACKKYLCYIKNLKNQNVRN